MGKNKYGQKEVKESEKEINPKQGGNDKKAKYKDNKISHAPRFQFVK
jgi:hypothetical protein